MGDTVNWLKKTSKNITGFTIIYGDSLQMALYHLQSDGTPQLITKEEFALKTTPPTERKRLAHSFLSHGGLKVPFQHLLMREHAFTKQFQFPSKNQVEIKQMLELRLPRDIPSTIDQIVYHFHPISSESQESIQTDVLLFGVSKDLINQERELLKTFGIVPQQIVLSTIVLSSYVMRKINRRSNFPRIILYGAVGRGEVILVEEQGIQFSRSFNYDSADLIHSVHDTVRPVFEALERKYPKAKTYELYIAGEMEQVKDELFLEYYPNRFSLQPAAGNLSPIDFLLFSAASVYTNEERFNLLPDEVKQKIALAKSEIDLAKFRFTWIILVVMFALTFLATSLRMAIALSAVNQKLSSLEPSVREIKEISRSAQMLHLVKTQKIRPLDLLVQIHEKSPQGIALTEFEYDEKGGQVHIKGRTDTQAAVDQYVRVLGAVQWFGQVELQYSESTSDGIRSQFQFAINATLKDRIQL
ncbi:MAG: PilN domain-containing protein [Candidatus Omnitrophica bacterium]|nr:PilN domain-containing protein [Candidatus Omnitrophota bacterium]